MKNALFPVIAAVALVVCLFILSSLGKKPPVIPHDAVHEGSTTQESCAACHAPGKSSPLKRSHPPKEQCLLCHIRSQG
jgi:hypothetical protein